MSERWPGPWSRSPDEVPSTTTTLWIPAARSTEQCHGGAGGDNAADTGGDRAGRRQQSTELGVELLLAAVLLEPAQPVGENPEKSGDRAGEQESSARTITSAPGLGGPAVGVVGSAEFGLLYRADDPVASSASSSSAGAAASPGEVDTSSITIDDGGGRGRAW